MSSLTRMEMNQRRQTKKKYVIVIEQGPGPGAGNLLFMTNDDGVPLRFETFDDARNTARGAMWEHAWVWWIVEFGRYGTVTYGGSMP